MALEALVAVAFLLPLGRRASIAQHALLLCFCGMTYAIAPVVFTHPRRATEPCCQRLRSTGDEPQPGCVANEIGCVLEAEHTHDFVLVGLDRARRDLERPGNLAHAISLSDQLEHLTLSRGQLGERLLSHWKTADPFGDLRTDVSATPDNLTYGRHQFLTGRVLRDEADGAGLNRLFGDAGIGVHREDDDLRRHAASAQLRNCVEPTQARHGEVGDDQVWLQVDSGLDETRSVEDSAHHLAMVGEQTVQPFGHHHVVISEKSAG